MIYAMSVSLDGFIEGPDGDIDWSYPDEELHQHFNDLERSTDILLYGRRLYENMAAHWPTADMNPSAPKTELEYAHIWKEKPKIVFSKTLEKVEWNSRLIKDNILEEVTKLKEQPGKILSVGGAGLASTFMKLGLIDEYRLYVHSVILGSGKPMFPETESYIKLEFIEALPFASGVVMLRYGNKLPE